MMHLSASIVAIGLLPAALAATKHFDFTIGNAVVSPDGFQRELVPLVHNH